MLRFGLCCTFAKAPIKFRTTTATYLMKLGSKKSVYIDELITDNITALKQAILYCISHNIKSFRINSRFCPAITHPEVGYPFKVYPGLQECKELAHKHDIRLTFHPDQFVVLNSPHPDVVEKSIQEIEYHATLADHLGADVINIHAGGVYGDKQSALARFAENFPRLSPSARAKLTLENDDKNYTPQDLLPLCERLNIPLVYDVHHHRCHPDSLTEKQATTAALSTWNREPLFHISSPLNEKTPSRHHDYINPADFPLFWLTLDPLTVEIEAKAKELAVEKLMRDLKVPTP